MSQIVDTVRLNRNNKNLTKELQIQKSTLPTASVSEVNHIYQYTGATGNGLVNGKFYKCVGNGDPVVYSWVEINIADEKLWIGTRAEATAAKTAGTYPSNGLAIISDESDEPVAGGTEEEDIPRWRKPQYDNGVKIVSFEDGTIPELQAMITAHKAGTINIYDYWHIGDHRRIRIDAVEETTSEVNGTSTIITPSQPAHYTDAIIADTYYPSDPKVIFLIKLGYGLPNLVAFDKTSASLSEGYFDSRLKIYLDSEIYPKIESGFRSLLSNFTVETTINNEVRTTTEKIIIPSYTEFGLYTTNHIGSARLPIEGNNRIIELFKNFYYAMYSTAFYSIGNRSYLYARRDYWSRSSASNNTIYYPYLYSTTNFYANTNSISSNGAVLPFAAIS